MTTAPPPALPERYFASYFDVVKYPASPDPTVTFPVDNWAERWQWIVMPRPPGAGSDVPIYVFSRHQNDKTHRAVWRNMPCRDLTSLLDTYSRFLAERPANRVPRDPIVVELSGAEVTEYVGSGVRKTPWEVIKRAQRAARRMGYTI